MIIMKQMLAHTFILPYMLVITAAWLKNKYIQQKQTNFIACLLESLLSFQK